MKPLMPVRDITQESSQRRAALWERIKLGAVAVFFVVAIIVSGSSRKHVLAQKDPAVINFLAADYCPEIVRGDGGEPLHELTRIGRQWEAMARQRHAAGVPAFHQPWKVRFLEFPSLGDMRYTWTQTRLMGGMAPEVLWAMLTPEYPQKCHLWYVDLTPYLLRPNPYVPGNKRWMDIFYRDALVQWQAQANGRLYNVPMDKAEVAIFYNKRILEECGIDVAALEAKGGPADWAEFIALQKQIKQHGRTPFLMTASETMRLDWVYRILSDMIWAERLHELHVVSPDETGPPQINARDHVRAYRKGLISIDDPARDAGRYFETWRIIKEWSAYWQPGFLGTASTAPFQRGEAAMTLDGSWFIKALNRDKERTWDYGVFFIPPLTKATTPYASGALPRGIGGATAMQYSITKETAARKGAVEAIVDLLMYVTAPQNLGAVVAEGRSFLPAVKLGPEGEKAFEDSPLRFMLPVLKRGGVRCDIIENLTTRCKDEWWSTMQYYLEGRYDQAKVQTVMKAAVERAIEECLDRNRHQWIWVLDAQGNNTWEFDFEAEKARGRARYVVPELPGEEEGG